MNLTDPDGRQVKGFSLDGEGTVVVDEKKASKDAMKIYNAMSKTETGVEAFKEMVQVKTDIKLKLTSKELDGMHAYVKTSGELDKDGFWTSATMTISTAKVDRFSIVESDNEIINVNGVHESIHLTKKDQIQKDIFSNGNLSWDAESAPLNYEYSSWKEWRTKYGQDLKPLKDIYEKPGTVKDVFGKTRPPILGIK